MEGNSAGSDSPSPGRRAGFWVLGALGVLLAIWGVSQYLEYLGTRKASGPPVADADRELVGAGGPEHPVSANLDVMVMDEKNSPFPVGTALPRRLMLNMANPDGQVYSMPFDKVGAWAVDAPAGDYVVPLAQEHLGNWRWKLEGEGIKLDAPAKAYRLKLAGREKPLTLKLTLY